MLPSGRRLGAHLPLGSGMVRAADRAAAIGSSAMQVFTDNPTSWRRREGPPAELPAFLARLAALDLAPLAIHAPYLVNLASPDPVVRERSMEVLASELRVAAAWGAAFLNVHAGSHRGAGVDEGAANLGEGLRTVLDRVEPGTRVVLENGAGGGFGLGATVEELAAIDRAILERGVDPDRVGFCLDTAHLWGAGYQIDVPSNVDALLAAFDDAIGLGRLRMVHLNDSRSEPGSRADRHEHIGAGRIGADGLYRFLTHPALDHVAYYLETPGMESGYDAINVARVLDIVAGRPLATLPPEAFEARGASGRTAPAVTEPAS